MGRQPDGLEVPAAAQHYGEQIKDAGDPGLETRRRAFNPFRRSIWWERIVNLLDFLPSAVRIERTDLPGETMRGRAQILFVRVAILIHEEGHDS